MLLETQLFLPLSHFLLYHSLHHTLTPHHVSVPPAFYVPQTYSFPPWPFTLAISFTWNTLCIASSFLSIRSQLMSLSLRRLLWPLNAKQVHHPVTPNHYHFTLPSSQHLLLSDTTLFMYVYLLTACLLRLERLHEGRDLDPLIHQNISRSWHRAGPQIFVD